MKRLPTLPVVLAIVFFGAGAAAAQDDALSLETCGLCHEHAEEFPASAHGRAMAARDPESLARSCAACHQPSPEHVEDPGVESVVRVPGSEGCSSSGCHPASAGGLALTTPAQPRHDVACLDCHGGAAHSEPDPPAPHLLSAEPAKLCGGCHPSQASANLLPFAHRDGSQPFSCLECHSAHGDTRAGRWAFGRSRSGGNGGVCLECHSAQAGPFVFPHPPREVDGCLACHEPHGSTNPRLLTRRNVLNLCLECHTEVPAFHDISRTRFRACQSCHFAVHGSNRDPQLFDE